MHADARVRRAARLSQLRVARARLPRGADGGTRAKWRRQEQPAGGPLLRLHRPLAAHLQRARAGASWGFGHEGGGGHTGRGGDPPHRGGLRAGRAQAPARGRQSCGEPVHNAGAPAGERLPARAARAREGRRHPAGVRTSTRWWPPSGPPGSPHAARIRARSRSATRSWAGSGRASGPGGPRRVGRRAGPHGRQADGGPHRGGGGPARTVRRARRRARPAGQRRAALPASLRGHGSRGPGGRACGAP